MLHVKDRVQFWIVVHFQLPVELEAALSAKYFGPQPIQSLHQVVTLFYQNMVTLAIALGMTLGRPEPVHLFGGMEKLEREDGKSVDDQAGRLGMQLGALPGQATLIGIVEQHGIHAFDQIVAALVQAVDEALGLGDVVVASPGRAGFVLGVPEFKVGKVVGERELEEDIVGRLGIAWHFRVPLPGPAIVKDSEFSSREHKCELVCGAEPGTKDAAARPYGRTIDRESSSFPIMTDTDGRREFILCITSYEKGQALLRQLAEMGCRVVLLTVEKLIDADWPRDILEELITMPEGLTREQLTNTVTYLMRSRKFERIIALDEFDMDSAAFLREHMRIPGMGLTTTAHFRDKLAMRFEAQRAGALVPEFTPVLNYDDLRAYMSNVPPPWVLKPRAEASAIGIRKLHNSEQLWRTLDELGDQQSHFLLERFVPGDIFHVDAITSERQVVFAEVNGYGKPPMQVMHEGGVFTTRTLDRRSPDAKALTAINAKLIPALGMVRGVTHTEYIRADEDGRYYFLEAAARVGGAFIAEVVEYSTGLNLWTEWARIEVCSLRGIPYKLPEPKHSYAGSVLCLARTAEPDTSAFLDSEIVYRMKKHHHAGLIVQSRDAGRVKTLLDDYSVRFMSTFLAVEPVPDKPTA